MYVICDAERRVVTITGLKLFGVIVDVIPGFPKEKDALDVLFAMEDSGSLSGHTVREVTNMTGEA